MQCKHEPVVQPIANNPTQNVKDSVCFEEEILPLLASGCAKSGCHDNISRREGIVLDSYNHIRSTISGQLLTDIIQETGSNRMPPAPYASFTAEQIQLIKDWVSQGMKIGVDCAGPCDSTNITYSATIKPIIQNSCYGCHSTSNAPSSGGSIILDSYANIKTYVDNGKLECTINYAGCSPMPKGQVQLSPCKLTQIRKWVTAGAPNN